MTHAAITSAMVTAAGYGKRLLPLTETLPKALITVNDRALISYTLDALRQKNLRHIVVNAHHQAAALETYLKQHYPEAHISHEPVLLETAGGVKKALPLMSGDAIFVINGDCIWRHGLLPVLNALEAAWDPEKMDALLGLVAMERAQGFQGKGDYDFAAFPYLRWRGVRPKAAWVQASVMIIKAKIYDRYPLAPLSNKAVWDDLEREQRLAGLAIEDDWFDIGNIEGLEIARNAL